MTNWAGLKQLAQDYKSIGDNIWYTNLVQPTAAHTKGSYYEIDASIPFDTEGLLITFYSTTYGSNDNLFDIAMGAEGSEVDIISNILTNPSVSYHVGRIYEFPLRVKAGTRISGRSQGEYTSANNFRVSINLLRGGWNYNKGFAVCDTYGANTADSGGTYVNPGGVAGTKGTWSQITASTIRDAKGFCLLIGNRSDYGRSSAYWNIDVGIGGSGSEEVLFSDWGMLSHTTVDMILPQATPFIPMHIPIGSRLSVRGACSITGANSYFDAVIYTFS